jgi:hypothetical protein
MKLTITIIAIAKEMVRVTSSERQKPADRHIEASSEDELGPGRPSNPAAWGVTPVEQQNARA